MKVSKRVEKFADTLSESVSNMPVFQHEPTEVEPGENKMKSVLLRLGLNLLILAFTLGSAFNAFEKAKVEPIWFIAVVGWFICSIVVSLCIWRKQ